MRRRSVAGLTLMLLAQLSLGAAFAPCAVAPSATQGGQHAPGGRVASAPVGAAHAHHMAMPAPEAQAASEPVTAPSDTPSDTPGDTPGDTPAPVDTAHCAMAMACVLVLVRTDAPRGLEPVVHMGRPVVALLTAPLDFAALLDPPPPKV
jgi:hypothetical protein